MSKIFGAATFAAAFFLSNAAVGFTPVQAPSSTTMQATDGAPMDGIENTSTPAGTEKPSPAQDATLNVVEAPRSLEKLVEAHRDAEAADREGQCLATAIYYESKGEPLKGQLAVAEVMLNRTQSGRFPSDLCAVVLQPKQFSFVHGGTLPSVPNNREWHTALAVAEIARNNLWSPVVSHAIFFHAKYVSPHWHATQVATVGNHIFYR